MNLISFNDFIWNFIICKFAFPWFQKSIFWGKKRLLESSCFSWFYKAKEASFPPPCAAATKAQWEELEGNLSARGSVVTAVNSVPSPERESPLTLMIYRLGSRDWPGSCLCVYFCFLPLISQHHGQLLLRFTVEQDAILGILRWPNKKEKKGSVALVTLGGQSEWERASEFVRPDWSPPSISGVRNRAFSPWVNCQWELLLLLRWKKWLGLH